LALPNGKLDFNFFLEGRRPPTGTKMVCAPNAGESETSGSESSRTQAENLMPILNSVERQSSRRKSCSLEKRGGRLRGYEPIGDAASRRRNGKSRFDAKKTPQAVFAFPEQTQSLAGKDKLDAAGRSFAGRWDQFLVDNAAAAAYQTMRGPRSRPSSSLNKNATYDWDQGRLAHAGSCAMKTTDGYPRVLLGDGDGGDAAAQYSETSSIREGRGLAYKRHRKKIPGTDKKR